MSQPDLDALPDGVLIADADGLVTVANAASRSMLGRSELVGRPLDDVLTLLDQDGRDWCSANEPYGGLGIRTGVPEQSWILPNGDEVLVNARLRRSSPTSPVDLVTLCLRNGRGRARLDRERSDLVATVAHELRSPLTGVKGFVQALLNRWDQLSDDQRKLMLTTVNADADRLARLIAELLDVARIDTGRLSIYPREVDPVLLAGRVVSSVQAATSRQVQLEAPEEQLCAHADPDKFTQVLTNLVENGVRHGEGTVRVSLRRLDGGEWPGVRLIVDDEGEGIAEGIRRRVFTKFWTGGTGGGSGLGMYIVGGLTRAHGGTVTITEAPGGGARVAVDWPSVDLRPSR
ncbi:PAS domain-containing sensor histidine kinase [Nocardioides sp. 616]|uniref:sensor histidine kinase n=1 Tax=Nocardioides sp. 616 TaxID=2268090 RepID=UPI000CE4C65D|nr:PAS domain-containing sensor histidine kinase [Nocardioides sp. 616]